MKAVAAMRNQFGGHAVTRPSAARPSSATAQPPSEASWPVHVSHLTLHDFRSYAEAEVRSSPG